MIPREGAGPIIPDPLCWRPSEAYWQVEVAVQMLEQHSPLEAHGAPAILQQPHGMVGVVAHCCAWPGQNPVHAAPCIPQGVSHVHWGVVGEPTLTQANGGGQSPAHIPGPPAPGWKWHGMVVVVVVGTGRVVVVVPGRIFSTGTQSIFGGLTVTSSSWNWSRSVTATAGGAGGKRPVSLLQSNPPAVVGVHCFT